MNTTHDKRGKFAKGNQAARRHGGQARERLLRTLTPEQLDNLLRKEYAAAESGDIQARQFLLSRWLPPIKPRHEKAPFDIDTSSLDKAAKSILEAIASGAIAPDVGESLMRSLNAAGNVGQLAGLAQRIVDLESLLTARESAMDVTPLPNHASPVKSPDAPPAASQPDWLEHATLECEENAQ